MSPIGARTGRRFLPALILCLAVFSPASAQTLPVGVFTYHNDLARTGQNVNETILTPGNVTSTTFGKQFADPVDGYVYAQPLYVANVAIPNQGTHNVVYVTTENDTVYAFDADAQGAPLWQTSLLLNVVTAVSTNHFHCAYLTPAIRLT